MIEFYSKKNCPKCVELKIKIDKMKLSYVYYSDDNLLMSKAKELSDNGKLIEKVAPIIILNGEQIKHKNINILKGE